MESAIMQAVIVIGPIKAARITEVVLGVVLIVGAIIFAGLSRSLRSIMFAASVVVLFTISSPRSRKLKEEEIIRRQDRLMGKPGVDEPKKMARSIP
jgi:membrane protein implicated in regulation of membrane protease activity